MAIWTCHLLMNDCNKFPASFKMSNTYTNTYTNTYMYKHMSVKL